MRNEEMHRAVLAAPDDDAPRIAYAAWLSAAGDSRGEFISLDLELAKLEEGAPRRTELATRRRELLDAYGTEWLSPYLPYRLTASDFRRGFVEELHDAAGAPLTIDSSALGDACLRRLVLCDPDSFAGLDRLLRDTRLRELTLNLSLEPEALAALLALPVLSSLESLTLRGVGKHAGHIHAITAAPLPSLRALALTSESTANGGAAADTFAAIAEWPHPRLRALTLEHSAIGAGMLAPILSAPPFASLASLRIAGTGVGEADVIALCASQLPLVALDLSHNALGPAAALALAATPRFANLLELGIANTGIGPEGLAALVASPHLARQCRLAVDGELLDLPAEVWTDGPAVTGASWRSGPTGAVTERFRVVVTGTPRWETCLRHL